MKLSFAIEDKGILPDRMIAALAADGAILSESQFAADQIQPASLDLHLSEFLPPVEDRVAVDVQQWLELHLGAVVIGQCGEGCLDGRGGVWRSVGAEPPEQLAGVEDRAHVAPEL